MEPVNIVCLKWGTKFGPEYVNRLYAGFSRNTTIPFNFHCFTENPKGLVDGVIVHDLPNKKLEGWWNKLYLFSKEIQLTGRILFVDLDTLIVGNVDNILSHNNGFVVLRDFYKAEKDKKVPNMGSGLMSFETHKYSHIWDGFMKDPQGNAKRIKPAGDQEWISQHQTDRVYWQDLFPNQIVSFKTHCLNGLPSNARIVCYHGIPSIPDSITKTTKAQGRTCNPAPWVADYWKDDYKDLPPPGPIRPPHDDLSDACFIVAGGPSLKEFDWSLLDDKIVIAINRSYEKLPNAQMVYFTDEDWWKTHKDRLLKHSGKLCKGSLPNRMLKHPQVKEYELSGPRGLDLTPGKLRHGHNSTYAAINMAIQLGYKKIYLLGVDMKWGTKGDKKTSHWHDGHKRTDPENVYTKMKECFVSMLEPLSKTGVRVYNVNLFSGLPSFPKISPRDVFGDKYTVTLQERSVIDNPKLLGDYVEQAINAVGGKRVAKAIERVTKKPCNCGRRKQALNNLHTRLSRQQTPIRIEPVPKPAIPPAVRPRVIPRAPQPKRK